MNRKNKYHRLIKAFKKKIPEYRKSPELFAYEVCQFEPDKWQKEVFADIAKFPKVTVRSGQGVGKTGCEAVLCLWFLSCFPYSRVVATAPTKQQLNDVLWAEVSKWQSKSPLLKAVLKWTKTKVSVEGYEERWFATARTATKTTVTRTYLYITVSHKTAEEMANQYNFSADQRKQLAELLADENRSMWSAVLYGIGTGDGEIVTVALSQIGNVGGEPYWSWYGFNSRVEWCACFVSWCANECGYIDAGVIPKFAGCVWGVEWFRDRGIWQDRNYEPRPGDIIFFDWDNKGSSGPQDGESDHVGIVEKVENGIVYTVEGNSGDSCRENHYAVGYYEILGYGVPQY